MELYTNLLHHIELAWYRHQVSEAIRKEAIAVVLNMYVEKHRLEEKNIEKS